MNIDIRNYSHVTFEGIKVRSPSDIDHASVLALRYTHFFPLFPNVKSLDIQCRGLGRLFYYGLLSQILEHMSQQPSLRVLKLGHDYGDASFDIVSPDPTVNLNIMGGLAIDLMITKISDDGRETENRLEDLAVFPNLRELTIQDSLCIDLLASPRSCEAISLLLPSFRNVRKLSITCGWLDTTKLPWPEDLSHGNPEDWTPYFKTFPSTYPLVEELSITTKEAFRSEDFELLPGTFPTLRHLKVKASSMWDESRNPDWGETAYTHLMRFENLETVRITWPLQVGFIPSSHVTHQQWYMKRTLQGWMEEGVGKLKVLELIRVENPIAACMGRFFHVPREVLDPLVFCIVREGEGLELRRGRAPED